MAIGMMKTNITDMNDRSAQHLIPPRPQTGWVTGYSQPEEDLIILRGWKEQKAQAIITAEGRGR